MDSLTQAVLGAVRLASERLLDHRTAARRRSAEIVTQSLQPHVPPCAPLAASS